jgi:hypothetical protein
MFLRMSIHLVILIEFFVVTAQRISLPAKLSSQQLAAIEILLPKALRLIPNRSTATANVQLQVQQIEAELPADPRTHHSPLPPPHTTQCSASALPRALHSRCPFSATPLPAAGLPALAQRASRALPTTLSTAREPLLSSMLLTLLVSGMRLRGLLGIGWGGREGGFWGRVVRCGRKRAEETAA